MGHGYKGCYTMERDIFTAFSPLEHRYYYSYRELFTALSGYFSESALIRAELEVEAALVKILARRNICPKESAREIAAACRRVTPEEVYREEEKTRHSTRALVNCIQQRIPSQAKPYVHLTVTSMDIVDTANALRYVRATEEVVLPRCLRLLETLIKIARREKTTRQIGRTHGQHAVPITFGFAVAEYISRFGGRIENIREAAENLRGKIAGAVGAYNAGSIFFPDPERFEEEVLHELGLKPSPYSTQIVAAEYFTDYFHAVVSAFGVLANLADDLRHLQRTELGELGEEFAHDQVGSSTMPHKRNPWNFEHIKSMWKSFMPRMVTLYLDQISEHQRDLTNSASSRFYPEIVVAFTACVDRLQRVAGRLWVDRERMAANLRLTQETIIAEPLYLLLAAQGHPNAHEAVRQLTLKAQERRKTLYQLLQEGGEEVETLASYLDKITPEQRWFLDHPADYIGLAVRKTEVLCDQWEKYINRYARTRTKQV